MLREDITPKKSKICTPKIFLYFSLDIKFNLYNDNIINFIKNTISNNLTI